MAVCRKLALATLCFAGLCLWLAVGPGQVASDDLAIPTGTIRIPVCDSAAAFDLTTRSPQDQYLVVVSSLSHEAGPFSVEITSEPTAEPRAIEPARLTP